MVGRVWAIAKEIKQKTCKQKNSELPSPRQPQEKPGSISFFFFLLARRKPKIVLHSAMYAMVTKQFSFASATPLRSSKKQC